MTDDQAAFLSILCFIISAVAWFSSALITPLAIKSYLSDPPDHVVVRLRLGSCLNAGGAIFAAAGAVFQAYASAH